MPKWISSTWYSVDYGWEHPDAIIGKATHNFDTPEEVLRECLEKLTTRLDKHQYTIKAIIPKTSSYGAHSSMQHSAWGYGISQITGFVVLAQHERDVSDEEYKRLSRMLELKNTLPGIRAECEKLQEGVTADKAKKLEIIEKKNLIGKLKYKIGYMDFPTREAAEAALAEMQAECSGKLTELEKAQAKIAHMENELEELKA